ERSRVDALFWWDKWDEAMSAYKTFIGELRGTDTDGRRARQSRPGRMLGVVAAIHMLRGETEEADRLERRLPASNPHFDLVYAHAMLGAGDPELALHRSTARAGSRATRMRSGGRPRRSRGSGASSSTPAASRSRATGRLPGPSTPGWPPRPRWSGSPADDHLGCRACPQPRSTP